MSAFRSEADIQLGRACRLVTSDRLRRGKSAKLSRGSLPGTSRVGSFKVRPAAPGETRDTNHGRTEMPTFITYASYSHAGIKGLVSEPADRTAAIKGLIEKAG